MTEIPEHLLKRSKERRSAIGGGDAPAEEGAPAGEVEAPAAPSAPVPAVAAAVEVEPAPVPEPVRPAVAAALNRRKIPFWALPVLAALPLWAYVYQATLEPAPSEELTPVQAGGAVFISSACSGCHGAGGEGSASVPGFKGVLETWPDFRDHMMWVRIGNGAWYDAAGEKVYGANHKASNGGLMPAHPSLTDEQLAEVVLYERVQFGGMLETDPDYAKLLAIADGTSTFKDAGLGPESTAAGIPEDDLTAG